MKKSKVFKESAQPRVKEMYVDDEYYEDEPMEPEQDDIYIRSNGFEYNVSAEGRHIGTFGDIDDAEYEVQRWMDQHGFYPNVWFVDDHGGIELHTFSESVKPAKSGIVEVDRYVQITESQELEPGDKIRVIKAEESVNPLEEKTADQLASDFIRRHGDAESALRKLVRDLARSQYHDMITDYLMREGVEKTLGKLSEATIGPRETLKQAMENVTRAIHSRIESYLLGLGFDLIESGKELGRRDWFKISSTLKGYSRTDLEASLYFELELRPSSDEPITLVMNNERADSRGDLNEWSFGWNATSTDISAVAEARGKALLGL